MDHPLMIWKEAGQSLTRRFFLKTAVLSSCLLSLPASAWAFFISRFPIRTVEEETFGFDPSTGRVQFEGGKSSEPYSLLVDGLVGQKIRLSYHELMALPKIEQVSDFHCVEGWSVKDIRWGGIRFEEIVKRVRPKEKAGYAVFHSLGGTRSKPGGLGHYIESMPLKDLLAGERQCLLALYQDGKPLTHEHGAPLRLICPLELGYKSIKYVTRIELSDRQEPGWWTRANPIYPVNAPVPKHRLRK